jgi:hypothetical protein
MDGDGGAAGRQRRRVGRALHGVRPRQVVEVAGALRPVSSSNKQQPEPVDVGRGGDRFSEELFGARHSPA